MASSRAFNENGLTEKEERFAREYVKCMNASQAYRLSYDCQKSKPETIWQRASEMLAKGHVKARIKELKEDIEGSLGISKQTILNDLLRLRDRCLRPEPVMEWGIDEDGRKALMQKIDSETGDYVWQFDSAGANSAIDKLMKAMGYYEKTKIDVTVSEPPKWLKPTIEHTNESTKDIL